jgi:hypothetical protein
MFPWLVDAWSLGLAAWACASSEPLAAALLLAAATAFKESGAAIGLVWWLLAGGALWVALGPLAVYGMLLLRRPAPADQEWLAQPLRFAFLSKRRTWLDWHKNLGGMGPAPVAAALVLPGSCMLEPALGAFAVAWLQTIVAVDHARLVAAAAVLIVPAVVASADPRILAVWLIAALFWPLKTRARELCSQIYVAIPHRRSDGIHPKLFEYGQLWLNSGMSLAPLEDHFGGWVDLFRAWICREFLKTDKRWLVMLDNDVVPLDAESILRLAANDLPVVSGIACSMRPRVGMFACVAVKDQTGIARFPTTLDTKVLPGSGLRQVESCGAGVLCIRRDVLETLREPPFLLPDRLRIEAVSLGYLRKTEDIYFCEQVRKAGFDVWVDFSVHCFHDKTIAVHWPREQLDEQLDAETWDVTSRAMKADRE